MSSRNPSTNVKMASQDYHTGEPLAPFQGLQHPCLPPGGRQGMESIAQKVGRLKALADGLEAPQLQHEDLKLVKHPAGEAFVIVSLPDYMAEAVDCSRLSARDQVRFVPPAGEKKYGNYYATGFMFSIAGPEAGVLWLVWGKEQGTWKKLSYTVIVP